jgi:predicted Zn-dependent protease
VTRTLWLALVLCGWLGAAPVTLAAQAPRAGATPSAEALAARAAEGKAAMEAGRFDQAAAIYGELAQAYPGDGGLQMNLGMARYMSGDPEAALVPLQKAVRVQPSLAPASLFLGAALLDLGRTKEAVAPLERAVKALPENPDAREMLARAHLELERHAGAAEHYRALTALLPESPKGWHGLARSYEGMAEHAFTALQQNHPESPLLVLLLADVLVSEERHADALRLYREALEGDPPVGGLHQAIAELYERAGKPEWAGAELAKAKPRTPAECRTHRAECEFLAGRFAAALDAARASSTPAGRYWTARAANRLATEALAHLEGLPPSRELHLIRAEMAQARGRNQDAVSELRAALALEPGDPTIEAALAETLIRTRSFDEALAILERLTQKYPGEAPLLFLYGDTLLQLQQIDRAIPLLEEAVKADESSVRARSSLGRAYVLAGRYEPALPHLLAAAGEDHNGDLHYQLARAYQALGRTDEAMKAMAEYQKRQAAQQPPPADAGGAEEQASPTLTPP